MYVKRKLKNTYTNFTVGEFLLVQKLGKHPLSTESGATMGGTDISLGRISGALAGASHWGKNIQIEKAAKRDGLGNAATALRAQYGFGDGMQRLQLESILKGDTVLARGTGTGEAETVAKDGKRTVYLHNYKDTMSREEQLAMGITLGHEAYRDGLVGSGQQQFMETARAVIGHTELALRMQSDARYTKSLDNIIADSDILQKDIAAYKSGDMMTMLDHVAGNYDWSKDYWKLVKKEDGSFKVVKDNNHSLVDENGNILIKNDMDIFDERGNIIGQKEGMPYAVSLGMLMGMYPDYLEDVPSYFENADYNSVLSTRLDFIYGNVTEVDANPFIMTLKDIKNNVGISYEDGFDNDKFVKIKIKNEYDQVVGIVASLVPNGLANFAIVENMVSNGARFKAGIFKINSQGIQLYGLGSSMPDPSRMGKECPAISDGTYPYVWSLHDPIGREPYPAMRLLNCEPYSEATPSSRNKVTGKAGPVTYPGFIYGTENNWGKYRQNFPGYYYVNGCTISTVATDINMHYANRNSFIPSDTGRIGGSDGCPIWYPSVWNVMTKNFAFTTNPIDGYISINRSIFGDGTGGKNAWQDW